MNKQGIDEIIQATKEEDLDKVITKLAEETEVEIKENGDIEIKNK